MNSLFVLACTLLSVADQHAPSAVIKPIILMEGLGNHHHPVATSNPQAQRFFDQGLTLIYAFNHDEAARSFRRAAELDPKLAMAWWGVALAKGPNYNLPTVNAEQAEAAYDALRQALKLADGAPEHTALFVHGTRLCPCDEGDPGAVGTEGLEPSLGAV